MKTELTERQKRLFEDDVRLGFLTEINRSLIDGSEIIVPTPMGPAMKMTGTELVSMKFTNDMVEPLIRFILKTGSHDDARDMIQTAMDDAAEYSMQAYINRYGYE